MNKKDRIQVRKAFINACLIMAGIGGIFMIAGAFVSIGAESRNVGIAAFVTGLVQCVVAATYPTVAVIIRDVILKRKMEGDK